MEIALFLPPSGNCIAIYFEKSFKIICNVGLCDSSIKQDLQDRILVKQTDDAEVFCCF